jgi:chaperone BCS1
MSIEGLQDIKYFVKKKLETPHAEGPKCVKESKNDWDSSDEDDDYRQDPISLKVIYNYKDTPSYGTHYFIFKNCLVKAERVFLGENSVKQTSLESLQLTTASWNSGLLREIVELAKPKPESRSSFKNYTDRMTIYQVYDDERIWLSFGNQRRRRPLETMILENNAGEKLLADVKKFLARPDWYLEKGIPYRKTYLVYGSPGCGKSSLVKSIAGEIGYDISILSMNRRVSQNLRYSDA